MAEHTAKGPQEESLRILGDAEDASARTFIFRDEDHTLGNSLRHVLMRQCVLPASAPCPARQTVHPGPVPPRARSKDTDFCGYSVPHPSEPLMNVRLQTTGRPANAVMDDGLAQLSSICDSLTAQLDAQEALATTRARSGSVSNNAFPGPGKKT